MRESILTSSTSRNIIMLTKAEFRSLLDKRGSLVIDGGLATQLEAHGHDLKHPLWSGKVLRDDPEAIKQVHLEYYLAGADIAITASYQTSTYGLKKHLNINDEGATELVQRSVRLAHEARDEAYRKGRGADNAQDKLLIAGSVGPYGAFLDDGAEYTGNYGPDLTAEEYRRFHHPRVMALIDAGVDLLGIETMPSLTELEAIKAMLKADFPDAIAWVSCTLRDAEHLSDGVDMRDVVYLMLESENVVAFGVNCVPITMVTAALQNLQHVLETIPEGEKKWISIDGREHAGDMPLLCYPNSGERWDGKKKVWEGTGAAETKDLEARVQYWREAGARLIGGCCRTGPMFAEAVKKALASK